MERIEAYRIYKGISVAQFAASLGMKKADNYTQLKRSPNPTYKNISLILETYPDLSAEYVLRGIEPMIKVDSPSAGVINSGTNTGIINTGNMENVNNNSEPSKEQLVSKMEELQRMFDKVMCK